MKKTAQALLLGFSLWCASVQEVSAQWAVIDAANLANTAKSVILQYNTLVASLEQVANQVKNLQRVQEAVVMINYLMEKQRQLDDVFNKAQAVSYNIATAERQFAQLYGGQPSSMSTPALLAYKQRMLAARFEASRYAVQIQAIQQNLMSLSNNIMALLRAVWVASGALDMAQMQAQQQALQLHQQQQQQAMDAAAQRLQAMREAEAVVNAQMALAWHQQVTTLAPMGRWQDGPELRLEVKGTLQ